MSAREWLLPNGLPTRFQDGDYVRIEASPQSAQALPFISGYVRGQDMWIDGDDVKIAYTLFKVGHNPLVGVKEEVLVAGVGQFGIGHGRGAHGNGEQCALCGANI